MPTTKIDPPPRCFGDQFKDNFPFIDALSQDTLNFIANLPEDKDILANSSNFTANINSINTQSKEHNEDEMMFRDLIKNYHPPFLVKVVKFLVLKV